MDANDILAQYLAGQAAQKNPMGIFGLRQSPFMTDADKSALRFQNLQDVLAKQGNIPAMLASQAGDQLGRGLAQKFGGAPDNTRPPDPQQQALAIYQQALQQSGDPDIASFTAYKWLAAQGVDGAMAKAQEAYKAYTEKQDKEADNKRADDQLEQDRKKNTWKDLETNARGQQIQVNELGEKRAVGSGPLVENNIGEQSKFDQKLGEGFADMFLSAVKDSAKARQQMNQIDQLETLMNGMGGGKLTPTGFEIARYAKSLGLDISDNLGNADAAATILNKMALDLRSTAEGSGMPGSLSDSDREFLRSMTPGLEKSPEGRAKLFSYYRKVYGRQIEVGRKAIEYKKRNGKLDEGFYTELDDYSQKNPLFQQQTSIATVNSKADYDKVKSGETYVDGRTGKKMVKR